MPSSAEVSACSDLPAADKVADLQLHQVAAPQFAVDRRIEQSPSSQAAALIEIESDCPNLLRFQRALRADGSRGCGTASPTAVMLAINCAIDWSA